VWKEEDDAKWMMAQWCHGFIVVPDGAESPCGKSARTFRAVSGGYSGFMLNLFERSSCMRSMSKMSKMKKWVIAVVMFITSIGGSFGQDGSLYTFFVNIVEEQFQLPLIGFVNIAGGSHTLPQIGFINWNQDDFSTVQLGFINTVGGGMTGVQAGFINIAGGDAEGVQLGFINYADSLNGIPIGFLSIVRNGGYMAVELGVSERAPFHIAFKTGVEKLYTSLIVSYNPFKNPSDDTGDHIMLGGGLGSIIQLGETFYVNPEITSHIGINANARHYLSLTPYVGYAITSNLSITAGPSLTWVSNDDNGTESPFYNIIEYSIDDKNKLYVGARMSVRFRW
jgi:hypothetical protein